MGGFGGWAIGTRGVWSAADFIPLRLCIGHTQTKIPVAQPAMNLLFTHKCAISVLSTLHQFSTPVMISSILQCEIWSTLPFCYLSSELN